MTAALEIKGLYKRFGALPVSSNIHLTLERGARHALIGPNGAGKTTLVNLITGALSPDAGTVGLEGRDVTHLPPEARVTRGLARTFQINQLFSGLTVLENVTLSIAERTGLGGNLWRRASRDISVIDEAMDLLERLKLADDALTVIRELPYGRQRLVEIAITLGQNPKVLLLDEPAAGVPSAESHIILDVIAALPDEIAILIIEHDMDVVFSFAERISVMVGGTILVEGTPGEIARDEQVRAVYLGEAADV
ncbi:MAG: ABC transporter ATP-binding protein [Hyphomicrobiales bacterium]